MNAKATDTDTLLKRLARAEDLRQKREAALREAEARVGECLRALVDAVSQAEAARLLGVSRQAVRQRLQRLSR